jgi:Ca2+-binding RTX toxin-like protein
MKSQFGRKRALSIGIALTVAVGLVAAPVAGAVTYPKDGGSGFDTDPQGWTGTAASCDPNTANLLCTESNFYSPTGGNPAGSIESQTSIIANVADIFTGNATWRSPTFTASTVGSGTFSYDREFLVTGIATLEPTATINAVLVDESTNKERSLGTETIDGGSQTVNDSASPFTAHTEVVPSGVLKVGDKYHLDLRSTMTTHTARAGVTGTTSVLYDNVDLDLRNAGPGGSSGSEGVTFVHDPLSLDALLKLEAKFDWTANKGDQPGGSIIARKDCTIVGTPGRDHIHGSKGNDVICGLGGKDTINGGGGHDLIDGGSGADRLNGAGSKDVLAGLAGRDRVRGGAGSDKVGGGGANDRLSGGPRRDRVNGGAGKDRATASKHDKLIRVERHS